MKKTLLGIAILFVLVLQAEAQNFYGTTFNGGGHDRGVIFSFNPSTTVYSKLFDFGGINGTFPFGSLLQAGNGKLYGMASEGGTNDRGVLYSYDPTTANYTKLKDFGGLDGEFSRGTLVQANNGKLYGMTTFGGITNKGVLFSFDPATNAFAKLKDFEDTHGRTPYCSLLKAANGKLYGMTTYGGADDVGLIFSFDPATDVFMELAEFNRFTTNGAPYGTMVEATDGKMYGMTTGYGFGSAGSIFSFDPATSTIAKLHAFNYNNGGSPTGSLVQANNGKLYGMTPWGGSSEVGVLFSFDPALYPSPSAFQKLKDFDYEDGEYPFGSLLQASDGKLYGMTQLGGFNYEGLIFSYDPSTATFSKLTEFDGSNGSGPYIGAALIEYIDCNPIITCPVAGTVPRSTNPGLCTYTTLANEFDAIVTGSCAGASLSYTLTGATSGTGSTLEGITLAKGTTMVTWATTDAGGSGISCSFAVVVNDDQNPTDYIIYATKEAKFGKNNYFNGNIGVTSSTGKAEFNKYDELPNPYFVKAASIKTDQPSTIDNKLFTEANDGPNPIFYPYNGSASGLSNKTVSTNNTILNGNWNDVTVKKGITATITGNNFGNFKIEEGANVTFTGSAINMLTFKIENGKKEVNTTNVTFSNPAIVKLKFDVLVENDCRLNAGGPKLTFFLGNGTDDANFTVNTDNTRVTANVVIPHGKLKTEGGSGPGMMNGWYVVEKLNGDGKQVTWNQYNCLSPNSTTQPYTSTSVAPEPVSGNNSLFDVLATPNPFYHEFTLSLLNRSKEPIHIRVMNVSGNTISTLNMKPEIGNIKLGSALPAGFYFIEVIQGNNRKVLKQVKLN